jgi:Fatty acid hydroxylase superfamily
VIAFLAAVCVVLFLGDAGSTFLYHVPQHLWGKLHLRTHHDKTRSYWDHAVLSKDPAVLLDGLLGALPYIAIAAFLCCLRPTMQAGALVGLLLGQLHVWWRHTCELGWSTPAPVVRLCRALQIVLPEDHNVHHVDPEVEFGDLFRFYDAPARALIARVRADSRRRRTVMRRLERMRARRRVRTLHGAR